MFDPSSQFDHAIWHLIIPAMVGAAIIGIVLRFLVHYTGNALVRFIRNRRKASTPRPPATQTRDAQYCPVCRSPMILRQAKRGAAAGQSFWGCPKYPACRGTRPAP
jgi:hypothetical protein